MKTTSTIPEDLIGDFKLGNHQAFNALHTLYFKSIWFFANKLIKDRAVAEDIAVDAFIKLWERRTNFDSLSQIKGFLYHITKNACLNHLKAIRVHTRIHKEIGYITKYTENEIEGKAIRAELIRLIFEELDSLPSTSRDICRLMLVEQLTSKEIAEKLHLSPQNVDSQIARAVKRIKAAFIRRKLISLPELISIGFLLKFYLF